MLEILFLNRSREQTALQSLSLQLMIWWARCEHEFCNQTTTSSWHCSVAVFPKRKRTHESVLFAFSALQIDLSIYVKFQPANVAKKCQNIDTCLSCHEFICEAKTLSTSPARACVCVCVCALSLAELVSNFSWKILFVVGASAHRGFRPTYTHPRCFASADLNIFGHKYVQDPLFVSFQDLTGCAVNLHLTSCLHLGLS